MKINLKVIERRKLYLGISAVMVVISLISLFALKLNLGVDFKGGELIQLKYEKKINQNAVNSTLNSLVGEIPQMKAKRVQFSDTDNTVIIRTEQLNNTQKTKIMSELSKKTGKYEVVKNETVGAVIGKELTSNAIQALLIGSILIIIYITVRFEFIYAVAGIVALIHDVIIAFGVIAMLKYEIDTPFIAAILTILGYSINDTIVVFDRIRENIKRNREGRNKVTQSFGEVIEKSINQVFTRSIYTSLTTLFSVIVLLILGGDTLKTFSMTLFIGMLVGTYSSVFVASPLVYIMKKGKNEPKSKDVIKSSGKTVNGYDEKDKVLV
ncbi:protein translocase subunit SecF [Leptotrichia alba]|uniref:Protein-export membrane protein SecF n=1 Tax=Leptotrichia alba TaxID=3239304 RepID=A0AB39V5D6_9FUSO